MMRFLTFALILAFTTWVPCASRGFSASQTEVAKRETSDSQRQKIQKQIDQKLRELDREISDLKAKAPQNEDRLREQFLRQMADLLQKREVARKKFEELKASTQRAWQDIQPDVDSAVKDLEAAYQRAAADFKDTK